jgi:Zn-dependent protease with chaperone function
MTDEQFANLVARLEHKLRQNPAAYQTRVLLLACLGNAYMLAVLLVVALMFVGALVSIIWLKALAVKLIAVLGVFLWVTIKALWIRVEAPVGFEVTRQQAPALFDLIDHLCQQLAAPRFHHVLVVDNLNAGVVQVPRLGLFGWPRNYLLLGLPLMKTMTEAQFTAVLAHEFGHLAHGHGRLGNWIYCQRLRWMQLVQLLEQNNNTGALLFKPFFKWFVPYFSAYSFPLARANEYQADAVAVGLTSKQAMAQALTASEVMSRFLDERYWPGIFQQIETTPQPGFLPFSNMTPHSLEQMTPEDGKSWLAQALARPTDCADTHPCLSDRLQALGVSAELAPPAEGQSADRLLGSALANIVSEFDMHWKQNIGPAWQERHQQLLLGRQRLTELNQRLAQGEELTVDEAFERFTLSQTLDKDDADTLAQLQALHQRAPQHALVCYALGSRLMANDDEHGCNLLQQAVQLDDSATLSACRDLRDYHARHERKAEAAMWQERLTARAEIEYQAEQERNTVRVTDSFGAHGMSADALAELCRQLRQIPGLRRAYLVKKEVKYLPQQANYVLGFSVSGRFQFHSSKRASAAHEQIAALSGFPGVTMVINIDGENAGFGKKMAKVVGSVLIE